MEERAKSPLTLAADEAMMQTPERVIDRRMSRASRESDDWSMVREGTRTSWKVRTAKFP